jgi:DNA-directed RNA polymerase specialized sigma24 family protein
LTRYEGENLNTETHDALKKAVKNAARSTADEWPGIVEADDIEQEIWLRLLESPNSAEKLVSMNDRDRRVSLNKIGRQLAIEERSSYELFSAQVHYSTDDVREILEAGGLVGEGFTSQDERMDFEIAVHELRETTPHFVECLWEHYEMGELDMKSSTNRGRVMRAVNRLTDFINSTTRIRNENYEGPGARTAISNEEARYITENAWEAPVV